MKFSLLVSTSQLNSRRGKSLGTGTIDGLKHLAELMVETGIHGDIYDLPNGSRVAGMASPFSISNGFALNTDELNYTKIPELHQNKSLKEQVERISTHYDEKFEENRQVSYPLKQTVMPWILEECYEVFANQKFHHRKEQFESFLKLGAYWIHEYALYEVYRELKVDLSDDRYRKINSDFVQSFIKKHQKRVNYYKYIQFLCFEQRQSLKKELKDMGIGLIVNLPFGVGFESADVYFHPEVFDDEYQIGCSPEPQNGFPEQAWGMAAYKEKTPGLKKYLQEKMHWLAIHGDGIFIDHLCGWCGIYVVPRVIPPDSVYPHGQFLTTDQDEREDTLHWFLKIVLDSGLSVQSEIAGDYGRVKVCRIVLDELREKGKNIGAMAIPRWEAENNRIIPLKKYNVSTLMMVETHDTSTLMQYLLNEKGGREDFESTWRIAEFCNRVLGLPFMPADTPMKLEEFTPEFIFEIFRRLSLGSHSDEIVFTLPSLLSLFCEQYRNSSLENNINVQPGTSGHVGNEWNNWSFFSPPIEKLVEEPELKKALQQVGDRFIKDFDYFHHLPHHVRSGQQLTVLHSFPEGREVVYRNSEKKWTVWNDQRPPEKQTVDLELVIHNPHDQEVVELFDLSTLIDLDIENGEYYFRDLNTERECYCYSPRVLKENKLYVALRPRQTHHFIISRHLFLFDS